jgi:early secretory antigenic target protein ESAT-6
MSDDILVVNFAALEQASADIADAVGRLETQLAQLERDAAPLVERWTGEAKAAYDARQNRWRRAATDLTAMLSEIKIAVDDSAADYLATEHRNANMFA